MFNCKHMNYTRRHTKQPTNRSLSSCVCVCVWCSVLLTFQCCQAFQVEEKRKITTKHNHFCFRILCQLRKRKEEEMAHSSAGSCVRRFRDRGPCAECWVPNADKPWNVEEERKKICWICISFFRVIVFHCFRADGFGAVVCFVDLKRVDCYLIEIEMFSTTHFIEVQQFSPEQSYKNSWTGDAARARERENEMKTESSWLIETAWKWFAKRRRKKHSKIEWELQRKKPAIIFRRFQFLLCAVNYGVGE